MYRLFADGNSEYDMQFHPQASKIWRLTMEPQELLKQERKEQEVEDFKEGEINWLEGEFWDSWDKVKGHFHNIIKPSAKKKYDLDETPKIEKWVFLAHANDTIKGKPQLIDNVQKRIPLIRLTAKVKEVTEENEEGEKEKRIYKFPRYLFFDERYDKRYDGAMLDAFALDFWLYRIISEEGKEYYIFSQEKLPNKSCELKGMLVEMDDYAEMSRSMKLKSLSRIFFMKSFEPNVKILSKEELVNFTESRGLTEMDWLNFLAYHKFGNYNRFPDDIEKLKSSLILSGKKHGYPNHAFVFGVPGTKKSKGWVEATAFKFEEDPDICEGGASSMKGLEPSFKDKPAEIGYLARKERMGWVDEIGKMIEKIGLKHHKSVTGALGSLNFLLEHTHRKALTGNDKLDIQATAKYTLLTNPIQNFTTIYQHIGLLDPSALSRFIVWVQDDAETEYLLNEGCVEDLPRRPIQDPQSMLVKNKKIENIVLSKSSGESICDSVDMSRDEFLTLFDTCYNFTCELDKEEVNKIVASTTQLAKEPMKSRVWRPRAYHHTYLMIDGLVKHRCLFKDYDATFTPKKEDYALAERILIRMVKGWDTNLAPKEDFR